MFLSCYCGEYFVFIFCLWVLILLMHGILCCVPQSQDRVTPCISTECRFGGSNTCNCYNSVNGGHWSNRIFKNKQNKKNIGEQFSLKLSDKEKSMHLVHLAPRLQNKQNSIRKQTLKIRIKDGENPFNAFHLHKNADLAKK